VRARPARAIVGVIVISLLAGGCVTKSAMMVRSAREVLTGLHEVQQAGRMLQVRYTTKTWYGPSRVREGSYKLPFKDWYSREAPGYYTPVAAYVYPGNRQSLILVKVVDEQRSVTALGSPTSCSFDRPWAPYARVALVLFAVIADVVTSPFQAVYFLLIGMSH